MPLSLGRQPLLGNRNWLERMRWLLGNPIPGLTCHLPDVPGSHNPMGREAWTSGLWRGEYLEVRKLGEKEKDGDRETHAWRNIDGNIWMDPKHPRG